MKKSIHGLTMSLDIGISFLSLKYRSYPFHRLFFGKSIFRQAKGVMALHGAVAAVGFASRFV